MTPIATTAVHGQAGYSGLLFTFGGMLKEIRNLSAGLKTILTRDTRLRTLPNWQRSLESFRDSPDAATHSWEIPEGEPLRTEYSYGEFDRASSRVLYAEVSSIWSLARPTASQVPDARPPTQFFLLVGKASTRTTVWERRDTGTPQKILCWNVDVGDAISPGAHFHVQVKGSDGPEIPVPRLPSIAVTPMDALEFVVGELFQRRWAEIVAGGRDWSRVWASEHGERVARVLSWKAEILRGPPAATWSAVKGTKPRADLFVGRS